MLFSSYPFLLLFLPLTLIGFYLLRRFGLWRASVIFLLAASLAFYAHWRLAHFALLIGSIAVNYGLGLIAAGRAGDALQRWGITGEGTRPDTVKRDAVKRGAMIVGVLFNLSLIFWFKYADFVFSNAAAVTGAGYTFQNLILPLGISFFTFQQIAYLVDCYRDGKAEARASQYALFVSFFPQLIAGPIVHHAHTRQQFDRLAAGPAPIDGAPFGLMIFAMGLAKKTLIADPIARGIDPVWALAASGEPVTMLAAWSAMIGYAMQIYFDFSGYCDMAIGLGLMVGIRLPINFMSPYKSASIIEFWRRWHITLSNFLRDYVYIPLGGNRGGEIFRLRNVFLTMLIGGIWHGAAWTFVIWGALHAAAITANHAARVWLPGLDAARGPAARLVKRGALLTFITISWVYFRADSLDAAHAVFAGLVTDIQEAGAQGAGAQGAGAYGIGGVDPMIWPLIAFASGLSLIAPNSLQITGYTDRLDQPFPPAKPSLPGRLALRPSAALAASVMLAGGIAVAWEPAIFIYFNF